MSTAIKERAQHDLQMQRTEAVSTAAQLGIPKNATNLHVREGAMLEYDYEFPDGGRMILVHCIRHITSAQGKFLLRHGVSFGREMPSHAFFPRFHR